MNEITTKEIYNLLSEMEVRLGNKIDKVYDSFMKLEEGKVTELLQAKVKLEEEIKMIRTEFKPVKLIVYGMVGLILLTVLSALLYLIIRK